MMYNIIIPAVLPIFLGGGEVMSHFLEYELEGPGKKNIYIYIYVSSSHLIPMCGTKFGILML